MREEEKRYSQILPPLLVCDDVGKYVVAVADTRRVGGIRDFGDAAIQVDHTDDEVEVVRVKDYSTDHVQM